MLSGKKLEKTKYYDYIYMKRTWDGGKWGMTIYRVSFWGDEKSCKHRPVMVVTQHWLQKAIELNILNGWILWYLELGLNKDAF